MVNAHEQIWDNIFKLSVDKVDFYNTCWNIILYLCYPLKLASNLEAPRLQYFLKSKFRWGK